MPPPLPPPPQPPPARVPRRYPVAVTLLSLALAASLSRSCRPGPEGGAWRPRGWSSEPLPEDQFPRLTEVHSHGRGAVKAVRIPVQGLILRTTESGLLGIPRDMTEAVLQQIRAATADPEVRGILLEVDSPGGAITPTDEIAEALRAFQASRGDRRIVAFVRDLAASGGYYVAARSDAIVAEPTAMVGSISVVLQSLNWHALSERIGVTDVTIKSGRNKDLLNPFQPVPDEQRSMLQRMVDDLHEGFLCIVREGRGLDDASLDALSDGSVFTAREARERGLVDEIGYWEAAVRRLADLLDADDLRLVRYQRRTGLREALVFLRGPIPLPGAWNRRGPTAWALWTL